MANMKNGLSYFDGGGSTGQDVETLVETPTESSSVYAAPLTKGAAKKVPLGPTQTADLLANMQSMIDSRQGPMQSFNRGLERAAAWGSGGIQGPSAALAQLNQNDLAEQKSTFEMRQQMAAYKATQAQQERFNQRKAADFGTGVAGAPGAITEATMPPQIRNALNNATTQEAYDKIYNTWAQKQAEVYASPTMDEPKIPVVENVNGQWVPRTISAREYRANPGRYQDTAQTKAAVQTTTAPAAPGAGITPAAIRQVESRGDASAVSPKGAEGTMQVMPATQTAPGFGVSPAANKTPQELERVGGDYFKAMQRKYGDDTTAAIAYNMGPGATDKWIAAGKKFDQLPAETQGYVNKLTAQPETPKMKAELMAAGPGPRPTPEQLKEQGAIREAATKEFATGAEKGNVAKALQIDTSGQSAPERAARFKDIIAITESPEMKQIFGLLAKKGFTPFVLKQLENGVNAGQFGTMGVAGLERNLMEAGATPDQIAKLHKVEKHLAAAELEYAKTYLTGQGAVSDNERKLVKDAVGSVKDPAAILRMQASVMAERAEFDQKIKEAYDAYRDRNGEYAPFGTFMRTDAKNIVNDHNQKLSSIISKPVSLLSDPINSRAVSSGEYQPGSIKWGNPKK